jgi:hypothetical protein
MYYSEEYLKAPIEMSHRKGRQRNSLLLCNTRGEIPLSSGTDHERFILLPTNRIRASPPITTSL